MTYLTNDTDEALCGGSEFNAELGITVGDVVSTGVYVFNEFIKMRTGKVVAQSFDGSISQVDTGTMHGCSPILGWEQTSHLRKEA